MGPTTPRALSKGYEDKWISPKFLKLLILVFFLAPLREASGGFWGVSSPVLIAMTPNELVVGLGVAAGVSRSLSYSWNLLRGSRARTSIAEVSESTQGVRDFQNVYKILYMSNLAF